MQKKWIAIVAAALCALCANAQTAEKYKTLSPKPGERIELKKLLSSDYQGFEYAIIAQSISQIEASEDYRAALAGNQSYLGNTIVEALDSLKAENKPFMYLGCSWRKASEINHALARNATFRRFIAGQISSFLKQLCSVYPSCFKTSVIKRLDETIELTDVMQHQSYEIMTYTHSYGYEEDVMVKNGIAIDYRSAYESKANYQAVYGAEGWIARRMVADNVPLSEIRGYLQSIREDVASVDVSGKADYLVIYSMNDMKMLVTPGSVICKFPASGRLIKNATSVVYMEQDGAPYYKIYFSREWVSEENAMKTQYSLYDKIGRKVDSGLE